MNKNNDFILKPEMYSQEEWYEMFMKSIETINNLQSKIDKANKILDKYAKTEVEDYKEIIKFYKELRNALKEDK